MKYYQNKVKNLKKFLQFDMSGEIVTGRKIFGKSNILQEKIILSILNLGEK